MSGTGPRILVIVASRHGSTAEIAEAIARTLADDGRALGITASVVPADRTLAPGTFDAVVLGSAVYAGRWLESAREYATTHAEALRARPVWLFSSGPIGEPPFPPDEPHDAGTIIQLTGAREHRVFAGRLEKERLSFGERAMVTAMRAPLGDFREWDVIRNWAREIAGHWAPAVRG
jgi:menaquinone-dependent protoporphyrinogen oxidase